jgi:hypothetical protein
VRQRKRKSVGRPVTEDCEPTERRLVGRRRLRAHRGARLRPLRAHSGPLPSPAASSRLPQASPVCRCIRPAPSCRPCPMRTPLQPAVPAVHLRRPPPTVGIGRAPSDLDGRGWIWPDLSRTGSQRSGDRGSRPALAPAWRRGSWGGTPVVRRS